MKHKGIRDIFYNVNDIALAFIVIIVAAGIIWWRMAVIMNYPQTLSEVTDTTDTTSAEAVDPSQEIPLFDKNALTKDVTITIDGGTATAAVQCLIDAKLFDSYDDFSAVCKKAGTSAEQIKASTFTFTKGSTKADIAKAVTK